MLTLMEMFGGLVDRIRGDSYTRLYHDQSRTEIHHLHSHAFDTNFHATITSRRVVYLTTYLRWWIPNRRNTVYHVSCEASAEAFPYIDPVLQQPVTYPLLCTRLLQWTEYPHIYAIHAFLGRIRHVSPINELND